MWYAAITNINGEAYEGINNSFMADTYLQLFGKMYLDVNSNLYFKVEYL